MTKKLLRPEVQTAIAALVNALMGLLGTLDLITARQIGAVNGVLAAGAVLLSTWYNPGIQWGAGDVPRWLEDEAA